MQVADPTTEYVATVEQPIERLTRKEIRDLITAEDLPVDEVRHLVDLYYQLQEDRKRANNIVLAQKDEPSAVAQWVFSQMKAAESVIQSSLDVYTNHRVEGRWAKSQHGIGPVITAGLLAHIDIEKAPTVGHIWRFAGLDPTQKWEKKTKRPWNARLKVLCWKIGDSFVKTSNSDKSVYGKIYRERKELELSRNEAGMFAEQAAQTLQEKRITDAAVKATYESGKLPLGRLELRARRYAVKLFLSHLHHVMYEVRFSTAPPKPYILTQPNHAHFLAPPNWPMQEGA